MIKFLFSLSIVDISLIRLCFHFCRPNLNIPNIIKFIDFSFLPIFGGIILIVWCTSFSILQSFSFFTIDRPQYLQIPSSP